MNFLEVNLVPSITDELLNEMLLRLEFVTLHRGCMRVIDLDDVDPKNVSYTFDPKLGRAVYLGWKNGWIANCPTWHRMSVFHKPSLEEVCASIAAYVPRWREARWAWLDDSSLRTWSSIAGSVGQAEVKLFDVEFNADGSAM